MNRYLYRNHKENPQTLAACWMGLEGGGGGVASTVFPGGRPPLPLPPPPSPTPLPLIHPLHSACSTSIVALRLLLPRRRPALLLRLLLLLFLLLLLLLLLLPLLLLLLLILYGKPATAADPPPPRRGGPADARDARPCRVAGTDAETRN